MALSENRTANQKILTASNDAHEECSICYDPFTNKAFASDCLHNFCYQCIYTWVQLRATCPLCLHPITAIIKNVRSIDDYDIEQVTPPQIDVFGDYLGDIDMQDDVFGYDSDIDDESMSDHELYEYEFSDNNENLPSASQSSQESLPQINIFNAFIFDDEYGTDESEEENEVSESVFPENLASSSEDEKDDDDNGDNDDNDENHSGNEEFLEDFDDEDYDNDDNNNEDEYEDDDSNDDYDNFSDTYEGDDDVDRSSLPRYSSSSECDSEDRSQEQGYAHSKFSDFDDSDSDLEYISSPFTASYAYSCDYF